MERSAWIDSAIAHLRANHIAFETGLTEAETLEIEQKFGFCFPSDLREFLQTALPVSGGFPNWRSESEQNLQCRYLRPPIFGIAYDIEHNDYWCEAWGSRPPRLSYALEVACSRYLGANPRMVPVCLYIYIPETPKEVGNPVFSVRQTDVQRVAKNLQAYLLGWNEDIKDTSACDRAREIPFWSDLSRTSRIRIPSLDGPIETASSPRLVRVCQAIQSAGCWAEIEIIGLKNGGLIKFASEMPTDEKRRTKYCLTRRDGAWVLGMIGPSEALIPDENQIPDLCAALAKQLGQCDADSTALSLHRMELPREIQQHYHLVKIDPVKYINDHREKKLREWEKLGWRAMSRGDTDAIWQRYHLYFSEQIPSPSITWDVAGVYLHNQDDRQSLCENLNLSCLLAMQKCVRPNEELLALDWQHTCYFFDPHAGLADGLADRWAVPVMPDGDFYHFLARDFRFGIISDCVARTICVFGQDLLVALAETPPRAFRKRTISQAEWMDLDKSWENHGWMRFNSGEGENDEAISEFGEKFEFFKRQDLQIPVIAEPAPSTVWRIDQQGIGEESLKSALTMVLLGGMQKAIHRGERLLALDWIRWYERYTFDPTQLDSPSRECWAIPTWSDDNYTIITASDFRFGIFGNPVEKTLCIFGLDLLIRTSSDLTELLGQPIRMDGRCCET